jgi:hypothetical protein
MLCSVTGWHSFVWESRALRLRVGRKTSSNDAISAEADVLPLLRSDDAAAVKTGRGGGDRFCRIQHAEQKSNSMSSQTGSASVLNKAAHSTAIC